MTEHEMRQESIEVVERDIRLHNGASLVGTNREVIRKQSSEYTCSCGEEFDSGRDARDHLVEVNDE